MQASEQYRLLMADVYELAGLSRRTSEAIANELGQTVARWHVLSVVSAGPCTVPAVARRLGLTRQGVQRVAGDLLAARLLKASPNPDHVRSPLLTLTNRGRLVLEQLTQRSDAARGRLLQQGHITAEDLAAARTTLRALQQSLATPDRNFGPGIPATDAELPVNDPAACSRRVSACPVPGVSVADPKPRVTGGSAAVVGRPG
jgi:DNA-binding MarR family transcriptional regulator